MKKTVKLLIAIVVMAAVALSAAACSSGGGKTVELTEFDVPATVTANFGESFDVPAVVAVDSEGKTYLAESEVRLGGQKVTVTDGKFTVASLSDYEIVYTVRVGGKDYSKTTVVKVVDTGAPAITVEGLRDFELGEKFVLPSIKAIDAAEGELTYTAKLRKKGASDFITIPDGGYEFTDIGYYELYVSAADSNGNNAERTLEFSVRTQRIAGEYEAFSDEYFSATASKNRLDPKDVPLTVSMTGDEVDGESPTHGNFLKAESTTDADNIALFVKPRFSKEELAAWIEDGTYNGIELRYDCVATGDRQPGAGSLGVTMNVNSVQRRFGYNLWEPDDPDHEKLMETFSLNAWHTVRAYEYADYPSDEIMNVLDLLYKGYDNHAALKTALFRVNTENLEGVTLYVDYIKLIRVLEIAHGAPKRVFKDTTFTLDDLGLVATASGKEVNVDLDVKISFAGADAVDFGESYKFENPGEYTITVTPKDGSIGIHTFTITVPEGNDPIIETDETLPMYTVGEEFTLPKITAEGVVDGPIDYTAVLRKKGGETVSEQPDGFRFTESGVYELYITATDSSENSSELAVELHVRTAPAEGELELFGDPFGVEEGLVDGWVSNLNDRREAVGSYVTDEVGGEAPTNGYYYKVAAEAGTGGPSWYINLRLTPRFTAEQLESWIAQGKYNAIEMRWYYEVQGGSGANSLWGPVTKMGATCRHAGNFPVNEWVTLRMTSDFADGKGNENILVSLLNKMVSPYAFDLFYSNSQFQGKATAIYFDYIKLVNVMTMEVGSVPEYAVGDKFVMPAIVCKDASGDIEYTAVLRKKGGQQVSDDPANYTFEAVGEYELVVTASDADHTHRIVSVMVRSKAIDGEYETFSDEYFSVKASQNRETPTDVPLNVTTESGQVGGQSPTYGSFLKVQGDAAADNIALFIKPRFTKEQLASWIADGTYNGIEIRYYLEATTSLTHVNGICMNVNSVQRQFGYNLWEPDDPDHSRLTAYYTVNKWYTVRAFEYTDDPVEEIVNVLDLLYKGYDNHASLQKALFRMRIDKKADLALYVDYVKLIKVVDVTASAPAKWFKDKPLPLERLGLTATAGGKPADVDFDVKVSQDDSVYDFGESYTFTTPGKYTITATAKGSAFGSTTFDIDVPASNDPVITTDPTLPGYEVGEAFTLPKITADGIEDGPISYKAVLRKKDGETVSEQPDGFRFTESGTYELYITATDSTDNSSELAIEFIVRSKKIDGEYETFSDEFYAAKASQNRETPTDVPLTVTTESGQVGGQSPTYGSFLKVPGSASAGNIALFIKPRFTKEELAGMIEEGYNGIEIRYYVAATTSTSFTNGICMNVNKVQRQFGYNLWEPDDPDHKRVTAEFTVNKWHTVRAFEYTDYPVEEIRNVLDLLTEGFDVHDTLQKALFRLNIGNRADLTLYIDYIKLIKVPTIETGAVPEYAVDDTFAMPSVTVSGDKKDYSAVLRKKGGAQVSDDPAGYKFTEAGEYELLITLTSAEIKTAKIVPVIVRSKAIDGEYETFSDAFFTVKSSANRQNTADVPLNVSTTAEQVDGQSPTYGSFLKVDGSSSADNIALFVKPRFTKEQLRAWIDNGTYNAIEIRYDCKVTNGGSATLGMVMNVHDAQRRFGENLWEPDDPDHSRKNTSYSLNTWHTVRAYEYADYPSNEIENVLELLYNGYDRHVEFKSALFRVNSCADMVLYVDYIKLVKVEA